MYLRTSYLLLNAAKSRSSFIPLSKRSYNKETTIYKCSSLIYEERGDPSKVLQLVETTLSEPKKYEVLVKMLASPINPADINMIQGVYPIKPELPAIGGNEGVGEIISVGSKVKDLKVGDRVLPSSSGWGTWRTHATCSPDDLTCIPKELSLAHSATLAINPCTAYRMIKDFCGLEKGDVVIQNGANSAVGKSVIQIASELELRTVNVVRDRPDIKELSDSLTSLGATHVVTEEFLRSPEMKKLLADLPGPRLGLNTVGGKMGAELLKCMAPGATLVTYGGMSKQPLMVPAGPLIFNDVKLAGFWMSRWTEENKGSVEQKEMIQWLTDLMIEGKFKVPDHEFANINDYENVLKKSMEPFTNKKQIFLFDGSESTQQ